MDQLVVGRAKQWMTGARPIASAINQPLRMLDAEADRKGFGFDVNATLVQHRKRIACAVADGEDDMVAAQFAAVGEAKSANLAVLDDDIVYALTEPEFATQRLNIGAHAFDHLDQPKRADMRFADSEDLLRCTRLDELFEHLATVVLWILDLAVQLAVGKRAGAAFTELHVGFRIKHAVAPERPGVASALAHGFATLDDDRLQAGLRENQCRHDSAGTATDNDGA